MYRFAISFLMLLLLISVPSVMAQEGGGEGDSDTGTDSKPTPKPPTLPPTTPDVPDFRNIPRLPSAPVPPSNLFISGIVVSEDGSPPPFGATIEMDCGESLTRQASVDGDGYFSFQVGGNRNLGLVMPDATAGFGQGPFQAGSFPGSNVEQDQRFYPFINRETLAVKMVGCDLRAQLPGYRSTTVRVREVLQPGQNDLGAIVVYPLERVTGTTVSVASLLAPKDAKKSLERAKKAFKKQKFDEAENHLKEAIDYYPQYGDAWFELGQLYKHRNKDDEAREAYMKAIEIDDLYVNPYIGLSWLSSIEEKWAEAAEFSGRAIGLDPVSFPEIYYLHALANLNLNNLDIAEKSARQYQRLDPEFNFPRVFLILSNVYALQDNDLRSIEEMRNYLQHAPDAPDAEAIRLLLRQKLAKADTN